MIKKLFIIIIFTLVLLTNSAQKIVAQEKGEGELYIDYAREYTGEDKWESFNRKVFVFNIKFNKYIIRPVNILWASVMPQYGMDRIQSLYDNMNYPIRLAGCLFQKDFKSAGSETKRFFTNTTIGLAGLYDPALTKFNIEPRNEDIEQVLAHKRIKQGPFLVLPIVAQGNTRDIAGQILDMPLNPCNYLFFLGPISLASGGLSMVNQTTYMQPLFKMADNYADPYVIAKQMLGIEKYIKNTNLDRSDVFKNTTQSDNILPIASPTPEKNDLKPDVTLDDYDSQGAIVDATRTILFDNQNLNTSKWSELSYWNKTFPKKIKTASVKIDSHSPKYKYRYILQKDKSAPIAVIYPSIGEGIMSQESMMQAKILYEKGYSVVIMSSAFNWGFVKSMPNDYAPGLPYEDAKKLRIATCIILDKLEAKNKCYFKKKILVGTSFGALTGLFVANEEQKENLLGFSNYIFICPPVEIFHALKQIDKISQNWQKSPENLKFRAAIMTKKVMDTTNEVVSNTKKTQTMPFNKYEAELAIGFAMKQKLYDVVFSIENCKQTKTNKLYSIINNMSFYDYAEKYLISKQNKSIEQLNFDSSIYSLYDFLSKNSNYKIYHSLDDCFTTPKQIAWIKEQTGNKSVIFSNGSHLGFLYRKEFLEDFKQTVEDIK